MIEQLNLFPLIPEIEGIEGGKIGSIAKLDIEPPESSIAKLDIEPKKQRIIDYCNKYGSVGGKGCVNQYLSPKNGKLYFRYSYRLGNRMKHVHIPGGNVSSQLVIKRAGIIKQMVNRGASTPEILDMISAFRKP